MDWLTDEMPDRLRVPLFPLPNAVLFPGAVLPLHIFEPRYCRMTSDVLDGDGCIAMALLRPGWEQHYYGRPEIEPVVCVGRIMAHERLPNGEFNFLLQGLWRARVIDETTAGDSTPYRVARLAPVVRTPVMEIDLSLERRRLAELFERAELAAGGLGRQFARLLASAMPTVNIADLIAFNYVEDVGLKQSLLADPNGIARVGRVVEAMEKISTQLQQAPPPPPPQAGTPSHDASLN
jgi:uncharacterized protein